MPNSFKYLLKDEIISNLNSEEDFFDLKKILEFFERASLHLVQTVAAKFVELIQSGKDPKFVFNEMLGSRLLEMGKFHSLYTVLSYAEKRIRKMEPGLVKECFQDLNCLFAAHFIQNFSRVFSAAGGLGPKQINLVQSCKEKLLEKVAPHSLKLAEGINYPDWALKSAIGHSNAKPYENLLKWAKEIGQLNQLEDGVHPEMIRSWLPYAKRMRKKVGQPKL